MYRGSFGVSIVILNGIFRCTIQYPSSQCCSTTLLSSESKLARRGVELVRHQTTPVAPAALTLSPTVTGPCHCPNVETGADLPARWTGRWRWPGGGRWAVGRCVVERLAVGRGGQAVETGPVAAEPMACGVCPCGRLCVTVCKLAKCAV